MKRLEAIPGPERVVETLTRYDEALVRKVATRLVRPRNQWPVEDLIQRCLETLNNPVVLDRRLEDLTQSSRRVLALVGHSRQPVWSLGNLVEMSMALGEEDGLAPVLELLEAGLLYPLLAPSMLSSDRKPRLISFSQWLGAAGTTSLSVFTLPQVATRALGIDLGLPDLSLEEEVSSPLLEAAMEADGLEWMLRLGALWQQVAAAPLRRTQQGGLFKRDVDRLSQDSLLNAALDERLTQVPDLAFWLMTLAEQEGILREQDGELRAETLPSHWENGLWAALESMWQHLFHIRTWSPLDGWRGGEEVVGNPFPSAYLLSLLLLSRLPEQSWVAPATVENWIQAHHPYWTNESVRPSRQKSWMETFLFGIAYPLRVIQVVKPAGKKPLVRLTAAGRWLLGKGEMPPLPPSFPKTLLVQPNLEIIAYRQGLTPALVARLTRLATWKTLGAACLLQLEPETVYRALELGESFDSLWRTLEQHSTRALPAAVLDSLRTWSNKRERITVYPAAALLEFNSPQDLDEALARGVPATRLSDTLAVVAREDQIEFRHFRLAGTRDYSLPPECCVEVEEDGVTLVVDLTRSDLMLETELPRFAELLDRTAAGNKRRYRLTASSLKRAREEGMTLTQLESWFQMRTGEPLSPAARLLLTAAQLQPPILRRHFVLHVELPEVADGLMQWPGTRELIEARLGTVALSVAEENLQALQARLGELGMQVVSRE